MELLHLLTKKRNWHLVSFTVNDIDREERSIWVFIRFECLDLSFLGNSGFEFEILNIRTKITDLH